MDLRGWEWHYVHRLCHSQSITLGDYANQVSTLQTFSTELVVAVFSPDGRRVLTASRDKTTQQWDATTGDKLFTLKGHTAHVTLASFSPDSRYVVTASGDYTVRVWNV